MIKTGREDEAVRVLIRYCESVTEAVDFALALNLSDMQSMWDMMLATSTNNTDRLNQLIQYAELQDHPVSIHA